jgi:hypothetical protein
MLTIGNFDESVILAVQAHLTGRFIRQRRSDLTGMAGLLLAAR